MAMLSQECISKHFVFDMFANRHKYASLVAGGLFLFFQFVCLVASPFQMQGT